MRTPRCAEALGVSLRLELQDVELEVEKELHVRGDAKAIFQEFNPARYETETLSVSQMQKEFIRLESG